MYVYIAFCWFLWSFWRFDEATKIFLVIWSSFFYIGESVDNLLFVLSGSCAGVLVSSILFVCLSGLFWWCSYIAVPGEKQPTVAGNEY